MFDKKSALFLAKFFLIFGFFHWLLFVIDVSWLQELIAQIESLLTGLPRNGSLIFIGTATYAIVPSCTGLVSAIILGAIIFSLKKPGLKQKIGVFAVGVVALFLVNLVRVYGVLLVGVNFGVKAAELAHVVSWLAMSAAIIFAWFFLTKKMTGIKSFEGFL